LLRTLQDHPHLLEIAYQATRRTLGLARRWLTPTSLLGRALIPLEQWTKGPLFDCRMCGQCVLRHTGMTCPMTCPKHLRNGPCGGVRIDGGCEIVPEMTCVWLQAWERSQSMPTYGGDILHILPPLDGRLKGTSAWVNELSGRAAELPTPWVS
jgi:hypothetical protein